MVWKSSGKVTLYWNRNTTGFRDLTVITGLTHKIFPVLFVFLNNIAEFDCKGGTSSKSFSLDYIIWDPKISTVFTMVSLSITSVHI